MRIHLKRLIKELSYNYNFSFLDNLAIVKKAINQKDPNTMHTSDRLSKLI